MKIMSLRGVRPILTGYLVISFLFSYSCGPSYAALLNKDLPQREGVKLGSSNMIFHSAFSQEEQYDSNVYLTDSDLRYDLVSIMNPSLGIEIPFRDNSISADYDCNMVFFGHQVEQDHIDHRVRGLIDINLTDYKIEVKDMFRHFTDRSGSENTARLKRDTNDLDAEISAEFERFGFRAGYSNSIEDYLTTDISFDPLTYEDRSTMRHDVMGELSYRFMPKTLFLLETDLGYVDYYNCSLVPNSWYTETVAGIKGEWFSRANVNFKAGFRYQHYESSDLIDDKPYIGPVLRGGFDYYITEDDTLGVRAERTIYESTYDKMNYYNVNLIGFDYTHKFSDKLSVSAAGFYQINLYPSETTENGKTGKRYDNFFGGSCGVRYDVRKWVSVEARYEYNQRISRFDTFDYADNLISLRGTVGF
ncbi:MAG: outer membrane beta-barrel protein [Candidatus Omnitrophota bacterium]